MYVLGMLIFHMFDLHTHNMGNNKAIIKAKTISHGLLGLLNAFKCVVTSIKNVMQR